MASRHTMATARRSSQYDRARHPVRRLPREHGGTGAGPEHADDQPRRYNMNQTLEAGGGVTYRHRVRGSGTGLRMIDNGWCYFPTRTRRSVLRPWEAKMVSIDVPIGPNKTFAGGDSRVTSTVRDLPCTGEVLE
jgi:hypothetical protein